MLNASWIILLAAFPTQTGDYVAPGSTPQGDYLRGQGQFLKGAAWYELNAAKAFEINSKAAMEVEKWNRQVYQDYTNEVAARRQLRKNMTRAQEAAATKKFEEREARLRSNPTRSDIEKGDALNALLVDLSDPSISSSSWRAAQVALRSDLSIPSLVFRFAPKSDAKGSQALGRGVIALARLDTIKGNPWGTVLSMDALSSERKAYELAYVKIRDQCLTGKLSLDAPIGLSNAIVALRAKVGKAVPTDNGYRSAATKDVDGLRDAAQIFHADTIDYAREMIADTQRHDAKTVGELLAFMRKYRLLFASAERTLGGGEMYSRLYGLMREQKEKLGIKVGSPASVATVTGDLFQKGSVWVGEPPKQLWVLIVLDRDEKTFRGRFTVGDQIREFTGSINGSNFQWLAKDVKVIKGSEGHNNYGTIAEDRLLIHYSRPDRPGSGDFVLKLKRD